MELESSLHRETVLFVGLAAGCAGLGPGECIFAARG